MNRLNVYTSVIFSFALLFSLNMAAQEFDPIDKSPMDGASYPSNYKISDKLIRINYGRPSLKGRELNSLAKPGEVWRTGANEAAELTLFTDMMFGGTKVKAGTYTFYVIPGAKEWTGIINKDLNVWGSYFYKQENDVARVSVPVNMSDTSLEAFSIAFEKSDDGVHMHLGWGNTRVAFPFVK